MTQQRFDAVIIGSGINALVAGAMLAKGGWTVALIERNRVPGGAIATTTAMFDGYTVEQLSSWHPLFVGGPAYGALSGDLAARGVVYQNTDSPTGVVCADGTAVLSTDAAATAEQMHALGDGPAWEQMIGDFAAKADLAFGVLGTDFWRSSAMKFGWKAWRALGTRGLVGQGAEMLEPAAPWLERTFTSPVTHALLAPWALHNGLGPDDASSAFITKVIAAAIAWGGMPVPVGGGVTVVDALIGIITDAGGALMTDSTVERIEVTEGTARAVHLSNGSVIAARKAIVASVTPQALYQHLLPSDVVPAPTAQAADAFRYGRAAMQIHIALDAPPAWVGDDRLARTAMVHVLDSMGSLSESVNAAWRGMLPSRPTIVVGQPATIDATRVPEGKGLLWIQLQENPRHVRGDLAGVIDPGAGAWTSELRDAYADRVIDQLQPHLANIRSAATGTVVLGPAEIEAMNCNLVGGDPYGGDCRVDQYAAWRPLSTARGHRTDINRLWHIGASTHPGPGLGGGSGFLVAQRLLRH